MEKVLVIAPHHDDEVIGCGGSILLHRQRGDEVVIVYVTNGDSGLPSQEPDQAVVTRRQEALQSCNILGVVDTVELHQSDRGSWSSSLSMTLVQLLRQYSPHVVYMPHATDGDVEHRAVYSLMREAVWQASGNFFPEMGRSMTHPRMCLGYEVWQPMSHYQLVRDITAVISDKKLALEAYQSQMTYQAWHEAIIGLNRYRGVISGVGSYAEVFQVIAMRE